MKLLSLADLLFSILSPMDYYGLFTRQLQADPP